MASLNRNASPSASTRHTSAPTRSGGPSGGTNSSCTVAPVFNRALVLTFAPCVLMSTDLAKYRLVPTLTTTGQATRVRGRCRRSCCDGRGIRGHSRQLACRPEGRLETARVQEDRSKPARVGCVLHSTRALTSASAPNGVLSKPSELPGTGFGSAQETNDRVTEASGRAVREREKQVRLVELQLHED